MDCVFQTDEQRKAFCLKIYKEASYNFKQGSSLMLGGADLFLLMQILEGVESKQIDERIVDWIIQKMNDLQYDLMNLHDISLLLKIPCACDKCKELI